MNELSIRLDNMETSIKNDVRTILDILRQQQQQQQQPLTKEQQTGSEKPFIASTSLQPSESGFSLDLFGLDGRRHRTGAAAAASVHRSISQPECANTNIDKSLLT